jgi:hypothetical protein
LIQTTAVLRRRPTHWTFNVIHELKCNHLAHDESAIRGMTSKALRTDVVDCLHCHGSASQLTNTWKWIPLFPINLAIALVGLKMTIYAK